MTVEEHILMLLQSLGNGKLPITTIKFYSKHLSIAAISTELSVLVVRGKICKTKEPNFASKINRTIECYELVE